MVVHNSCKQHTSPTVEMTSHTEIHTQCSSIKSKEVKNNEMNENLMRKQPSKAFPYNKCFLKNAKSIIKSDWVKLSPTNFPKIKFLSDVVSKNFVKTLIYLSTYISSNSWIISLNSGIVASKISRPPNKNNFFQNILEILPKTLF